MEVSIIAAVSLNQVSLDYKGNTQRIIESIKVSVQKGAKIRVGAQNEITGNSLQDHFLERETYDFSWIALSEILVFTSQAPYSDILCVVSMPVQYRTCPYICGIFIYGGKVLLIKPKLCLTVQSVHREKRWFLAWQGNQVQDFDLPQCVKEKTGQLKTAFGNALLKSEDGYLIGLETMQELQQPIPQSTKLFLMGAHIVLNTAGSPFEYGALQQKNFHIKMATQKIGGVYVFANQIGCDGHRLYYDGSSMIALNGNCVKLGEAFSVHEMDVIVAAVDLSEVDSYSLRIPSKNMQAQQLDPWPILDIQALVLTNPSLQESLPEEPVMESPQEQILKVTACFLWDYIRRTGVDGVFIRLDDSFSTVASLLICRRMCELIFEGIGGSEIEYNNQKHKESVLKVLGRMPQSVEDIMKSLVFTGSISSVSKAVAQELNSTHFQFTTEAVNSIHQQYLAATNRIFMQKQSAVRNNKERCALVMSYLVGQLIPWTLNKQGILIVISATNLEDNLVGNLTKYGLSSGDLNLTSQISVMDLRRILEYSLERFPSIQGILDGAQVLNKRFEERTGLTYEEVATIAQFRMELHCGPTDTFLKCKDVWNYTLEVTAQKVKDFFVRYAKHRHKMTVSSPSVHLSAYSCDDNRFDLRPFLYNTNWSSQFQAIEKKISPEDDQLNW